MVREVGIGAGDGLAACHFFGFQVDPISGQHEFRLGLGGGRACLQRDKGFRDLALGAYGDMDVAGLKHATQVGFVR